MNRFLRHIPPYLPTALVLIAILYISLAPNPMPYDPPFELFRGADKVVHFVMYGALTGAFCFDYYRHRHTINNRATLLIALLTAIAIGAGIEWLQEYMALGRSNDWKDLIANTAGAISGTTLGHHLFARIRKKR